MSRLVVSTLIVIMCLLLSFSPSVAAVIPEQYISSVDVPETVTYQYLIQSSTTPIGSVNITEIPSLEGTTLMRQTTTTYPAASTTVQSIWVFDTVTFPRKPLRYTLDITAPQGHLNVALTWDEALEYLVETTGQTGILSADALPFDNNVITDYALMAWLFNDHPQTSLTSGIILPSMLAQTEQIIPATVTYQGTASAANSSEEVSAPQILQHYLVTAAGIDVHIWVDIADRRLIHLEIPQQGYEITLVQRNNQDVRKDMVDEHSQIASQQTGYREYGEYGEYSEHGDHSHADQSIEDYEKTIGNEETGGNGAKSSVTAPKPNSTNSNPEAFRQCSESEVALPLSDGSNGTLYGTLTEPCSLTDPNHLAPGILMVSGSGPTDRDGNNPLAPEVIDNMKEIAEYMTAHGNTVLRFDKRGVGTSTGYANDLTFPQYAEDVVAFLNVLQQQPGVDPSQIFIIGHSEGAVLAAMAAASAKDVEVAGIVLLAAPGLILEKVLRTQIIEQGKLLQTMGFGEDVSDRLLKALEDLLVAIHEDLDYDAFAYDIPEMFSQIYDSMYAIRTFATGWLRTDPAKILSEVTCPILIIHGEADDRVSISDAESLASSVSEPQRTLVVFPKVTHTLEFRESDTFQRPVATGNKHHVHEPILETVAKWVEEIGTGN